jgi:DNA-directed RNA polymerase beta subunit
MNPRLKQYLLKLSSAQSEPKDSDKDSNLLISQNKGFGYKKYTDTNEEETLYPKTKVGVDSLIAASKKLLAINKGEAEPDDRDALKFKRVLNVDDLMAERARMDAGKLRNALMWKLSKTRSLQNFPSNIFDSYTVGHIVSNNLSLPSEEINPLYNLDQSSRLTVFGQGGISSVDVVNEEAQNVNPSSFGFLDPLVTPDGMKAGVDSRMTYTTRIGHNGKLYTKVRNKRTGKLQWLTPEELETFTVAFPD